ncbi:DnaJ -like subfamily C member 9 [Nematocida displodere]|uniref:DnaJ-like subfamily C member 9 n=1 Tax=Nematocida displodere TaxID=1805483 RepID=A0A177EJB3_9MICR|nr:DnaJ -like subfamily C member 9 [Nematocida displodere]
MKPEEAAALLGCTVGSTADEIKKAFKRLALKVHPDRPGGSEEGFMALNTAYDVLTSQKKPSTITKNAFDRFKTMYQDSLEEREELVSLYRKHKGNMAKIVDAMLLGEDESEERYRAFLDKLIAQEELPGFPIYRKKLLTNKPRQKKRQKEAAEAEELAQALEKSAQNRNERWNAMIARLEEKTGGKKKRNK